MRIGDHSSRHGQIQMNWDFPGGPVVKNLPSNAGDAGLTPGQGTKIPHAAGQLSPCAKNYSAYVPWSLRITTTERKPARHN